MPPKRDPDRAFSATVKVRMTPAMRESLEREAVRRDQVTSAIVRDAINRYFGAALQPASREANPDAPAILKRSSPSPRSRKQANGA